MHALLLVAKKERERRDVRLIHIGVWNTSCRSTSHAIRMPSYPYLLWRLVVVVPFLLLVLTVTTVAAADESCTTPQEKGSTAAAVCSFLPAASCSSASVIEYVDGKRGLP